MQTEPESVQWNALLVQDGRRLKELRCTLEESNYYDHSRRIMKLTGFTDSSDSKKAEHFAIPITQSCVSQLKEALGSLPHPLADCKLVCVDLASSKKEQVKSKKPYEVLKEIVRLFLNRSVERDNVLSAKDIKELLLDLPKSWERHGDLVVLPVKSFMDPRWQLFTKQTIMPQTSAETFEPSNLSHNDFSSKGPSYHKEQSSNGMMLSTDSNPPIKNDSDDSEDIEAGRGKDLKPEGPSLWQIVASALKCKRLAMDRNIACNHYRSSSALLLLGDNGWVEHVDNGVRYIFDITKCMFSSGNISEKLRVAKFDCRVHTGASKVIACEWNPDAVEALQRGLVANKVKDRCIIYCGDNRKVAPKRVADRVNLGLVPSSEGGWPIACAALKTTTGGWLHIHGNVSSKESVSVSFSLYERQQPHFYGTEHNPWEAEETKRQGDALINHFSSQASKIKSRQEAEMVHCSEASCGIEVNRFSKRDVWQRWGDYVSVKILELLGTENPQDPASGKSWHVSVGHVEQVKSYAPHIDHLVVDIECRPVSAK